MAPRKTLEEKFYPKVDRRGEDECWMWTGATLPYGPSGVLRHDGKMLYAHRVAYKLAHGRLAPYRNHNVLHSCENKLCCNPKHLFLGSLSEAHALIGVKKRRDLRAGRRNLTTRQKNRIRARALLGDSAAQIQRDYPGVHYSTVLKYVREVLSVKNNG